MENCRSKEQCNADISGLYNYNTVIAYAKGENKLSSYPAFEAVDKWNAEDSEHKAPENTTGWYLPAVGQWYDFFHNLGDLPDWGSASVSDANYYWSGQSESVLSNVNTFPLRSATEITMHSDISGFGRLRSARTTAHGTGAGTPLATCTATGSISSSIALCVPSLLSDLFTYLINLSIARSRPI